KKQRQGGAGALRLRATSTGRSGRGGCPSLAALPVERVEPRSQAEQGEHGADGPGEEHGERALGLDDAHHEVLLHQGPENEAQDDGSRRHLKLLEDRKSTRLNSSHVEISYAVFCLKKKTLQR